MENRELNHKSGSENNKRNNRKGSMKGVFYCVRPVLLMFAIMYAASLALVIYALSGGHLTMDMFSNQEGLVEVMNYLLKRSYLADLGGYAVSFIAGILIFLTKDRKNNDALREKDFSFKRIAAAVLTGIGMYMTVDIILTILSGIFDMRVLLGEHDQTMQSIYTGKVWLDIILLGLLAPLTEEIFFRGLSFNRLREIMPEAVAVLVSGAFFGGLHSTSAVQMLYAIALGCLLGWLYTKSENIIYPILLHAAFNLMNFPLALDGVKTFLETQVGILCYYFIGVATLAGGITLIKKMEKPPLKPTDYNDGIVE